MEGGLQAIWQALTLSMALVSGDKTAHDASLREPVHAVIGLMSRPDGVLLTIPLSAHQSITAALTLLFSDLWPRELASGNAHQWCMHGMLRNITVICKLISHSELQPQLHLAFLVSWPFLMGWSRQQACRWDVDNLMVRH